MSRTRSLASLLLNFYFNRLPYFRGKWRLLRPFARVLNGTPVQSRYGVTLGLDLDDRTNQLCVLGRYGDTVPDAVATLGPGECFVDVGANCGVFSLLAARRVGPTGLVVAFEPCFATFAKLVHNIELNDMSNVLAFNVAIADDTGFERLDNTRKEHSGRFAIVRDVVDGGETVASLSLADFPGLLRLMDRRPALLKIDVEGFELVALHGLEPLLARSTTHGVVVEIDADNLGQYGATPGAVFELLADHGFERSDAAPPSGHFDAVFARVRDARPGRRLEPVAQVAVR